MHFLKTLFWVVLAVSLAIFANRNWIDVTVNLWSDLQADIKLPILLMIVFRAGFLPPLLHPSRKAVGIAAPAGGRRAPPRAARSCDGPGR